MTEQIPITPPPELVEEWANDSVPRRADAIGRDWEIAFATRAAQWGADQELKACCEFENKFYGEDYAAKLRRHRRPQPPSLAEEALEEVGTFEGMGTCNIDIIRRALERLQELEDNH